MKAILWVYGLFCCLAPLILQGQSNRGTEFWFSFMEHRDSQLNTMVAMITSPYATTGTLEMPLTGWRVNFSLSPNQVRVIQLPIAAETIGSERIQRNGFRLSTEAPAEVYIHQYFGLRSEASLVLPTEALGADYYVMAYQGIRWNEVDYPSEFLVVAREDSTVITIQPSVRTRSGKIPGRAVQVVLDAGETYQVQAAEPTEDVTGSRVTGTRPFALFAGARWTQVPSGCSARDNLLEQMYPLPTWGRQFVSAPFYRTRYDVFRVMAAEDNTQVEVDAPDRKQTYRLNRGEFIEWTAFQPQRITGDKPIQVAQYLIGSSCNGYAWGDPSMVLLNSIEQNRDTVTFYSSPFENILENYVNLIIKAEDTFNLTLDGIPVQNYAPTFLPVPGGGFVTASLRVGTGSHTLISRGCGLIATAYGYGDLESYAYSGGANYRPLNVALEPVAACVGDSLDFTADLSGDKYRFDWDLGDGNRAFRRSFLHAYEQPGVYVVTMTVTDECLNISSTVEREVRVSVRKTLALPEGVDLCEGETLVLEAETLPGATYVWSGPGGFESEGPRLRVASTLPEQSGIYGVTGTVDGCQTEPASALVNIEPLPMPDLGRDTFFCSDQGGRMTLAPSGTFDNYRWQDGSMMPAFEASEPGLYRLTVSSALGCQGSDSLRIDERCVATLEIPNVFTPNGDPVNNVFQVRGEYLTGFQLEIFDRWGKNLFLSKDMLQGWDGNVAGQQAPEGVYFWRVIWEGFDDRGESRRQERMGHVVLMR